MIYCKKMDETLCKVELDGGNFTMMEEVATLILDKKRRPRK